MIAFGVTPASPQTGAAVLRVHRLVENALRLGFHEREASWIVATNHRMRNIVENFGVYRRVTTPLPAHG